MSQEPNKKIISKHEFYFNTPLYEKIPLEHLEEGMFNGDVDAYSNTLQDNTTYEIDLDWVDSWTEWESPKQRDMGYAEITLSCKRRGEYILRFFVYIDNRNNGFVEKIGQNPSLADLQFSQLQKKYEKVLEDKYLKEFKKAVGLASHGIGVGSFVYLRRIFEKLIFQTFNSNKSSIEMDIQEFKSIRMEDKIEKIKDFLPSQLLKMKSIYGILSKGIHELDDDLCLKYFGPLKLSIELILDQQIDEAKKREKDKDVEKKIQNIQQEIK